MVFFHFRDVFLKFDVWVPDLCVFISNSDSANRNLTGAKFGGGDFEVFELSWRNSD